MNKLLAPIKGEHMLSHILRATARCPFARRLAVVQAANDDIAALCRSAGAGVVENRNAKNGMGASIAAGVREAKDMDAVMIILGDMPFIRHETFQAVYDLLSASEETGIVAPRYRGRRGHPVGFGRSHFAELGALSGDAGANGVIEANRKNLTLFDVEDPGVLQDIDVLDDASGG